MDTGTEKSTRADNRLGVYTMYDEDGRRHEDKQLEAQVGPQADALVRMGYRFDQQATDAANAKREAEADGESAESEQSSDEEDMTEADAPKRGRRG